MKKLEPKYVTSEQARLLKEKGFNIPTNHYYFEDAEFRENFIQDTYGYKGDEYEVYLSEFNENWNDDWVTKKSGDRCFGCSKNKGYFETFSAPEQWQVVEWLRVNHSIWVSIKVGYMNRKIIGYRSLIFTETLGECYDSVLYDTPQEAYSTAFDYILEKLI